MVVSGPVVPLRVEKITTDEEIHDKEGVDGLAGPRET